MDLASLGSKTAKDGFNNEHFVISTFNNWKTSKLATDWLIAMGYNVAEIEEVNAYKINGSFKADIQVIILIQIKLQKIQDIQNIQVKLVSNKHGYNQIDKRWLKSYKELWSIPDDVYITLQYFTGEILPKINNPKDARRMFFYEFDELEQSRILEFFRSNQPLIISDIIKGRGKFASEWFLVILREKDKTSIKWVLKPINEVINFYSGNVEFSPQGNLKIGKITMQRKGGDAGRDTAKMLQFKIKIMIIRLWSKAYLFDYYFNAPCLDFFLLLFQLIKKLTIINDTAYWRVCIR